jgi:hypothetical protein
MPIQKWNSRLLAMAVTGLTTLASLSGVDADVRAVGIAAVTVVAVVAIAVRDVLAPGAPSATDDAVETATPYPGEHHAR